MTDLKIYDAAPADWKQLQQFTGTILSECGFDTEIEKTIETVRGKVQVDVYAERKKAFESKTICECKYWQSPVPQTIIHAFRTIISDTGASQGFIISKAGFQKGAYDAIVSSNVSILSWEEFQDKFKMEWLTQVIERNYKVGRELMRLSLEISRELHKGTGGFNETQIKTTMKKRNRTFISLPSRSIMLTLKTTKSRTPRLIAALKVFKVGMLFTLLPTVIFLTPCMMNAKGLLQAGKPFL